MEREGKSRAERSAARYDSGMRPRVSLLFSLVLTISLAVPLAAHAGIPFFGPIIPQAGNQAVCPASFGMLMEVINNIIQFLLTIAIVFVAPLTIGYAGFLFVINPANPGEIEKAKGILWHTISGLVVALAAWMIVAAIMAVLYNPKDVGGTWMDLIGSQGIDSCIKQAGALPGEGLKSAVTEPGLGIVPPGGAGRFTYDPGIDVQKAHASSALANLLTCMEGKVPAGVGRISSISDSLITSSQKTFAECAVGACQHAANSCHYGGREGSCIGSSYAVDFGDEINGGALREAATTCGADFIFMEGNHLHVSVGKACGCN